MGRLWDRLRADLPGARAMYVKAALFVFAGVLAGAGVVAESAAPLRTAVLLGVAVWAFCRAYYFAFYVVEKYIDPGHRYAGLGAFAAYLWRRRKEGAGRR